MKAPIVSPKPVDPRPSSQSLSNLSVGFRDCRELKVPAASLGFAFRVEGLGFRAA